jgi:alpha-galactosidase
MDAADPARPVPRTIHLSQGGVSLVVDISGTELPSITYWGAALGALGAGDLASLHAHARSPWVADSVDLGVRVSVLPEPSAGWLGRPGLSGHRAGGDVAQQFQVTETECTPSAVRVRARSDAGLDLRIEIEMTPQGLVRQRAAVRNVAGVAYTLDEVTLTARVPARAVEVLDLAGSHMRERTPQRAAWDVGERVHESRRGRPGLQSTTFVAVGERAFSFAAGETWAVHVAWSGNHRMYAEHSTSADKIIGGGELLLPGEVILADGEEYVSPWVYFAWGNGIDDLARRFHGWLRATPGRARRPRPVTVNTWEAVHFDHRAERLIALAEAAGRVGAERFVLDDGWFGDRRDDRRGLGDWVVSSEVWRDGLRPLIDAVRAAGMEFGLWVEPEMVNVDSQVFRDHPDWVLGAPGRLPLSQRHQQVLNLSHPEAYAHVRDQLEALLDAYEIAYLKWDHNRDLIEGVEPDCGSARVHRQTLAFYRMVDELKASRPALEIESCASGGGRVDLAVLERTDRIWASDSMDPIQRQHIQRWTGVIVPPELVGSHIGPVPAQDTGRITTLDFRAITAMFGHFGIELDLTELGEAESERIAEWVAYSKTVRALVASGITVRVDDPDPSRLTHGLVSADRSRGLFAVAAVATSLYQPAPPATLRGLDRAARYRVRLADPLRSAWPDEPLGRGIEVSGELLQSLGVRLPHLRQSEAVLLDVVATSPVSGGA